MFSEYKGTKKRFVYKAGFQRLFMRSKDRNMAVVSQSFGVGAFEKGSGIALMFGDGYEYIDSIVLYKIINGLIEIIHGDKIAFGVKFVKHLQ